MRLAILLTGLCIIVCAGRAQASQPCMMVAQHDTHAVEDPTAVWQRGKRDGPVTEYQVNNKTGLKSFCLHGGYCYLASVNVNGQTVEALRLTNCRIQPGSATTEGDETSYGVEAVPARPAASPAQSESPKDIQVVRGACTAKSFTANGPVQQDISDEEMRFSCDGAAVFFMDSENRRITIRFVDSQHLKDGPMLGFAGEMQSDGKTLNVKGVDFLEAGNKPTPVISDSFCGLEFEGKNLSSIACFAHFNASGIKYVANVIFNVAPSQ